MLRLLLRVPAAAIASHKMMTVTCNSYMPALCVHLLLSISPEHFALVRGVAPMADWYMKKNRYMTYISADTCQNDTKHFL